MAAAISAHPPHAGLSQRDFPFLRPTYLAVLTPPHGWACRSDNSKFGSHSSAAYVRHEKHLHEWMAGGFTICGSGFSAAEASKSHSD
eukprot:9489236-Pyramimonas_sp.AAC.1